MSQTFLTLFGRYFKHLISGIKLCILWIVEGISNVVCHTGDMKYLMFDPTGDEHDKTLTVVFSKEYKQQ